MNLIVDRFDTILDLEVSQASDNGIFCSIFLRFVNQFSMFKK